MVLNRVACSRILFNWSRSAWVGWLFLWSLHSSTMHTARSLTVSPSMLCSGGVGCGIPACTEAGPPPWTESQTPVKILPCPNFVAGGNEDFRISNNAIWFMECMFFFSVLCCKVIFVLYVIMYKKLLEIEIEARWGLVTRQRGIYESQYCWSGILIKI